MGCNASSVHPATMDIGERIAVEIAGMSQDDIELLVERKEIVHYRVVTLKTEFDRYNEILTQLENPKIYQQKRQKAEENFQQQHLKQHQQQRPQIQQQQQQQLQRQKTQQQQQQQQPINIDTE